MVRVQVRAAPQGQGKGDPQSEAERGTPKSGKKEMRVDRLRSQALLISVVGMLGSKLAAAEWISVSCRAPDCMRRGAHQELV